MTIYEFQSSTLDFVPENLFELLPSAMSGKLLYIVAFLVSLFFLFRKKNPGRFVNLLLPTLFYSGLFITTFGVADELAINLEHPYNLFHYGRFSMSPGAMIDGTVEVLFYVLLTPFASTQASLILGNFLISFLVGWLHLYYLWYRWFCEAGKRHMLLLAIFAMAVPLVTIFSSGFGNGLVSLVLLVAIGAMLQKRVSSSLVITGLLPLIRPDAILIAGANSLFAVLKSSKEKKTFNIRFLFLAVVLPGLSLFIYLLFFKLVYGHFVPTPVLFKKVTWDMIANFSSGAYGLTAAFYLFSEPRMALCSALLVGSLFIFRKKENPLFSQRSFTRDLLLYLGLLTPIFIYYVVTVNSITMWAITTRYWTFFYVVLFFLVLSMINDLSFVKFPSKNKTLSSFLAGLFFFSFFLVGFPYINRQEYDYDNFQRTVEASGGQFADEIMPVGFRLSSFEMNTFGFASEREVIDLVGYSNRNIAESKICSGARIRANPDIFLELRPEVYWPYLLNRVPDIYDDVEVSLHHEHFLPSEMYSLGDMREVINLYDVVILRMPQYQVGYFVRRDKVSELKEHLKVQYNFSSRRERRLNDSYLQEYDQYELARWKC